MKGSDMPTLVREQNGVDCWTCFHCGRDYPQKDEQDNPQQQPTTCHRCGAPMDTRDAVKYGNQKAQEAHDPQVRILGDRLRGGPMPGATGPAEARGQRDGDENVQETHTPA